MPDILYPVHLPKPAEVIKQVKMPLVIHEIVRKRVWIYLSRQHAVERIFFRVKVAKLKKELNSMTSRLAKSQKDLDFCRKKLHAAQTALQVSPCCNLSFL